MDDVGVSVRWATVSDAAEIAALVAEAWRQAFDGLVPQSALRRLEEPEQVNRWVEVMQRPQHQFLVAVAEEQICGCLALVPSRDEGAPPTTAEVASLHVHPSRWGHGVGYALMRAAVQRAKQNHSARLTLWVFESNERARRFYERQQFVVDGARKMDWRGNYALPEVRYELKLRPPSVRAQDLRRRQAGPRPDCE